MSTHDETARALLAASDLLRGSTYRPDAIAAALRAAEARGVAMGREAELDEIENIVLASLAVREDDKSEHMDSRDLSAWRDANEQTKPLYALATTLRARAVARGEGKVE